MTIVVKIAWDQVLFSPICIAACIFVSGAVFEAKSPSQIIKDTKELGTQLWLSEWFIWPPAQFVNFYFLPTKYRVVYDNLVSLFYDWYTSHLKHKKLFLVSNKISKIENLETLTNLTMLELRDNRIRKIEKLETLVNVEELFLGKNKIRVIENLDSLSSLRLLSIQTNRIREFSGLSNSATLEEVYIADNGITSLAGLESHNLQTLDISNNKLEELSGVEHMNKLEELWANGNNVSQWSEVDKLKSNTNLLTVYLEHNPVAKDPQYRRKLKLVCPSLTQIDATLCK